MKLVKVFFLINALLWLPYGLACLFNPVMLTELTGIAMSSATAMTEIRAMYGGVQSAIGLLCLLAVFRISLQRPALLALGFVITGVAVSRAIGLAIDSSGSGYTYGGLGFEAALAVITWLIYCKLPVQSA